MTQSFGSPLDVTTWLVAEEVVHETWMPMLEHRQFEGGSLLKTETNRYTASTRIPVPCNESTRRKSIGGTQARQVRMHLENQNRLILHILERLDQRAEPGALGEQGANVPL